MGQRVRQFADPTVISAVVLLLLNDRVLKGNGPAWLTGKLSDVAGVYLVAMIVGIVTARPDVAVATTAVGFGMIKLSYGAAQLAAPVLGGVTRQDHTDLVALLALVPAWLVLRRTPSPLVSGSVGALLATTALVFAGIGVTATSCDEANYVDAFAVDRAGELVARIRVPVYEMPDPSWARSVDGGLSWQPSADPGVSLTPVQQACDASAQCFRVIENRRVEQTDASGEWHTAFGFSGEQRRRMESRAGMCERADDGFRSLIVVDDQPQSRVIVAMGEQGALVRTPDGRWGRHAVLDRKPISLRGSSWLAIAGLRAPIVGLLLTPLVYALARWRAGRARGRDLGNQSAIVQGAIIGVAMAALVLNIDYFFAGPLIVAATVLALLVSLVRALSALPVPGPVAVYPPPPKPLPPPPPPPSVRDR
ncbi:MAG: hypothetical protein ABI658_22170 [Acidimicrobiales bacterium]